ncbi:MAG TPA: transcription antitermination factor NusB [Chitinophagaceae bacterium]|nr:transcription antitermination factor NusB [Chitinophagaceae bacterium]
MISRRNIRVKVMQTLYSIESMNNETKPGEPIKILEKNLEHSRQLFTYLVYFITEVARYAEADAAQKAHKHLPTQGDLNINTKIAANELVWTVLEDASFKKALTEYKVANIADRNLIRRVYLALTGTEAYKAYISIQGRDKKSERKILEFIFSTLMLPDEDFINHMEENFIHWDDDADMMVTLMDIFLQKPSSFNFGEMLSKEKLDFAKDLLNTVLDKKDHTLEIIKPKLKNWDVERIAALDMILMQMGVCELLYFETIPPRVTINEYIDLAKEYSTPQSGHFVNGILDNIHKELISHNKIHKKNFRNSTL